MKFLRASNPPVSFPRFLERLETRVLLTAVSWTGTAGDNQWTTPGNWSNDQLPQPGDDVTISVAGNPTIQIASGTQTIHSLVASDPINIANATLTVATTLNISQNLTLSGGVISGGIINETWRGVAGDDHQQRNNRLVNVQVNGDVGIGGGSLRIGGTFGSSGVISLVSGGQLGLTKAVRRSHRGLFQNGRGDHGVLWAERAQQTLTIGSGVVVHGYGTLGQYVFVGGSGGQSIVNQGVINGDVSGQTLTTSNQLTSFTNSGTLTATGGGGVNIGAITGSLNTVTVTGSGSRVILSGTYVNNQWG